MITVKPTPKLEDIEAADDDPLALQWVRYLASVAMTGVATVVAIAVDFRSSPNNGHSAL